MKVKELIEKLKKFDEEKDVLVYVTEDSYYTNIHTIYEDEEEDVIIYY